MRGYASLSTTADVPSSLAPVSGANKTVSTYDYIIVGGGSAGCVLANRLSATPPTRVLLIESGPRKGNWWVDMPLGFVKSLESTRFNWRYRSEPEPNLKQRRLYCPVGRVLGGSSAINGMMHVRGHPEDFEHWEQLGASGWGAHEVLEYFKRTETYLGVASTFRGLDGPLRVSPARADHVLHQAFLAAGEERGLTRSADFNSPAQEGVGVYDHTIVDGRRVSAASAYLPDTLERPNLEIRADCTVTRIVLDEGRAVAVEVAKNDTHERIPAEGEIILSAGAIGSPHVLQQSGIGDADSLRGAGIQPTHHLPGVGLGLQNHVEAVIQYRCRRPLTILRKTRIPRRWISGVRWFVDRGGICATNHWETGAFLRTNAATYPDTQIIFFPIVPRAGHVDPYPVARLSASCRHAETREPWGRSVRVAQTRQIHP